MSALGVQFTLPHSKKCWGMALWTWQRAQGINLDSTCPGSQHDRASVEDAQRGLIQGGPTSQPTRRICYQCPGARHHVSMGQAQSTVEPQWIWLVPIDGWLDWDLGNLEHRLTLKALCHGPFAIPQQFVLWSNAHCPAGKPLPSWSVKVATSSSGTNDSIATLQVRFESTDWDNLLSPASNISEFIPFVWIT